MANETLAKSGLILTPNQDAIKPYILKSGQNMVGSSDTNDIVISDKLIDSHHCNIYVFEQNEQKKVIIQDKNSKNGILVNHKKVDIKYLKSGDEIQIGNIILIFEELKGVKNNSLLNASNGKIDEIRDLDVSKYKNIKSLNLSFNNLISLPKEVVNFTNLEEINLTNNSFKIFPNELLELQKLKVIHLDFNTLEKLPSQIENLQNLEQLSFINNNFKIFPIEILKLKKLKILHLDFNNLKVIPIDINKLEKLETLSFIQNSIGKLPFEILELINLKILNLLENRLNIPIKILRENRNPSAIFNYYFKDNAKGFFTIEDIDEFKKNLKEPIDKSLEKISSEEISEEMKMDYMKSSIINELLSEDFKEELSLEEALKQFLNKVK